MCKPCVNDTGAEVAEQQLLQQLPFCLTTAGHKTNCSWREDNIRTSVVRSLSLFIGISEQWQQSVVVVVKKNLIFGAFQKLRLLMPPHATNLCYAPKVATAR